MSWPNRRDICCSCYLPRIQILLSCGTLNLHVDNELVCRLKFHKLVSRFWKDNNFWNMLTNDPYHRYPTRSDRICCHTDNNTILQHKICTRLFHCGSLPSDWWSPPRRFRKTRVSPPDQWSAAQERPASQVANRIIVLPACVDSRWAAPPTCYVRMVHIPRRDHECPSVA